MGVLQRLAQTVENFVKTSVALNLILNDYQSVHAFSAVTNGGIEGAVTPGRSRRVARKSLTRSQIFLRLTNTIVRMTKFDERVTSRLSIVAILVGNLFGH